jgi:phytoene dehydrogenase-like protein
MTDPHLIIVGGGLSGLSAGCYALHSGFRVTVIEHNLALGGVCTAWRREPYLIDGCIHWLTGGEFDRVYDELGILSRVPLRTLTTFTTYRHVKDRIEIPVTRDLGALEESLAALSPTDSRELRRLVEAASEFDALKPPLDAPDVTTLRERFKYVWEAREIVGSVVHFRKPLGEWVEQLKSPQLRRFFTCLAPPSAPAFFLLMILGYLEKGYLSRPVGGTAAFRDALADIYRELGGEVILPATVDEVLVEDDRARGVRMADGTMLKADCVVSTASAPETVLRLLGGRYDAEATRNRLEHWKLFEPIVLASFGVAEPYAEAPSMQLIDGIPECEIAGRKQDYLYVRVCNDDPCFAPAGHTVVQAMLPSDYAWWATRGSHYESEKDAVAESTLNALEPYFPRLRAAVRLRDIATPITYWSMARSWRGAFEGWMPNSNAFFTHPKKTLDGLSRFIMAGQWVEPGGGVPTSVLSGRQAIQLLCAEMERPFVATANLAA